MTVEYIHMSTDGDWEHWKCFYGQEGQEYGEFYLHINRKQRLISFSAKDEGYRSVLSRAFDYAMIG